MLQSYTQGIWEKVWLGKKGDPLVIGQEIQIQPYFQMVFVQTRIYPRKCDPWNSLAFWDTNGSPNKKRKKNYNLLHYAILVDHRAKSKKKQK